MHTIRITKEFKFEMAHALLDHDGPCKNIHGHSYQLSVTLKGNPIEDSSNPKEGMVVDFSDLKKLVNEEIVNPFDHALMLNKRTSVTIHSALKDQKLILVEFQPTCENIIVYISKKLKAKLDTSLMLHHIMLRETATSFAEWFAEDNK